MITEMRTATETVKMSRKCRGLLIAIAVGFGAGILIMAVAIFFGYSYAYAHDAAFYQVKLAGLPIYELTRTDSNSYSSVSVQTNMGIIWAVCMVIVSAVWLLVSHLRKKK